MLREVKLSAQGPTAMKCLSRYPCPGLSPKFMLLTINNASLTSSIWPLGNNSRFLKSGTENAFNQSSYNVDPITNF